MRPDEMPGVGAGDPGTRERVLVLAPFGRDADVVARVLAGGGIASAAVAGMGGLADRLRGPAGAVLVTEEALTGAGMAELAGVLVEQPPWSDVPFVILLSGEERLRPEAARLASELRRLASVTVLVRPVAGVALLTAVEAALRARRRQYEARDLMEREGAARRAAEESAREAERANRLKDEFLASVSHELRTPLTAIKLWAQLVALGGVGPDETAAAFRHIEASVDAQSHLIDDLLDSARLAAGTLRLKRAACRLGPTVRSVVDMLRPLADEKGVRLETPPRPDPLGVVLADAERVRQVVWNLVSNAVKFTPAGGTVRVRLLEAPQGVGIEVADTGRGIGADFLPHVFERFRQEGCSPGGRQGGLGLGLAITWQLVELHGGTIVAASEGDGRGTTMTVLFPLATPGVPFPE